MFGRNVPLTAFLFLSGFALQDKPPEEFRFAKGTKWTYTISTPDSEDELTLRAVAVGEMERTFYDGRRRIRGAELARGNFEYWLFERVKGEFRVYRAAYGPPTPQVERTPVYSLWYKFELPLKEGGRWNYVANVYEGCILSRWSVRAEVKGGDRVTVGRRKVDCTRVDFEFRPVRGHTEKRTERIWLSPEYGVVRAEFESSDVPGVETWTLREFRSE